jgi:hypothetical protein
MGERPRGSYLLGQRSIIPNPSEQSLNPRGLSKRTHNCEQPVAAGCDSLPPWGNFRSYSRTTSKCYPRVVDLLDRHGWRRTLGLAREVHLLLGLPDLTGFRIAFVNLLTLRLRKSAAIFLLAARKLRLPMRRSFRPSLPTLSTTSPWVNAF